MTIEEESEVTKFLQTDNQNQKKLLEYVKKNSKINEQIQSEILKTLSTAYDETDITNPENPFYNENIFIKLVLIYKSIIIELVDE